MTPKQISIAISELLSTITTENGFESNAGNKVYRGKVKLEESMIPCIVLGEADDESLDQVNYGKTQKIKQKFVIDAWVPCDPDHPNDAAHDAIADIKKLLFTGVNAMGMGGALSKIVQRIRYVKRSIGPRPEGGAMVSGTVIIEIQYVEELA